jgi:hypothetical protein
VVLPGSKSRHTDRATTAIAFFYFWHFLPNGFSPKTKRKQKRRRGRDACLQRPLYRYAETNRDKNSDSEAANASYSVQTPDLSALWTGHMPDSPIFFHMQGGDGNGGVCLQVREKGSKSLKKSREFYVFFCFTERTFHPPKNKCFLARG